jgi:hypothetical protein
MSALLDFIHERLAEERELIGQHRRSWLRLTDPTLSSNAAPQASDDDAPAFTALATLGISPFTWARSIDHLQTIAERHGPNKASDDACCRVCLDETWPCDEAKLWAARWSGHPDFRPEWTPQTTVTFHGETR